MTGPLAIILFVVSVLAMLALMIYVALMAGRGSLRMLAADAEWQDVTMDATVIRGMVMLKTSNGMLRIKLTPAEARKVARVLNEKANAIEHRETMQ